MRYYDENIVDEDLKNLKRQLENLLDKVNSNDITYGACFRDLERITNYTIGVSYDDYINENTTAFLEHIIENEQNVDYLYEYIEEDVYYEATCNRLIRSFEYESSEDYYDDSIYIDKSERYDCDYDKVKEILRQGMSRNITTACDTLSLDVDNLNKRDLMKIANYLDITMYRKELETSSFSFSKDNSEIEF